MCADPPAPPSPWEVVNDYSKTVITLGSALLAVTITFSVGLLGKLNNSAHIFFLVLSWVLLVLAIGLGIAAMGFLITYLKNNRRGNICIFCANAAFYALLAAGIAFLVFGIMTIRSNQGWDVNTTMEKTLVAMPTVSGRQDSVWGLQSLAWDESSKSYHIILIEEKTSQKFSLNVDTVQGRIIKAERIQ